MKVVRNLENQIYTLVLAIEAKKISFKQEDFYFIQKEKLSFQCERY